MEQYTVDYNLIFHRKLKMTLEYKYYFATIKLKFLNILIFDYILQYPAFDTFYYC